MRKTAISSLNFFQGMLLFSTIKIELVKECKSYYTMKIKISFEMRSEHSLQNMIIFNTQYDIWQRVQFYKTKIHLLLTLKWQLEYCYHNISAVEIVYKCSQVFNCTSNNHKY